MTVKTRTRMGIACSLLAVGTLFTAPAQARWAELAGPDATPDQKAFLAKLDKLKWVDGPTAIQMPGNATLQLPEGYVYLDRPNTRKYLELNENLSDGSEVMVAPADLSWTAYLGFLDEGYVKDDEEIDAAALLQQLKDGTEAANEERRKRGWPDLHVVGWASPPAYNRETKRLEWATTLESEGSQGVNFFTKILGRRGHTSVQMVSNPDDLATSEVALNGVLGGFDYNAGNRYADFKPGDKVAEYGLAAMVVGGATAVAAKKGLLPAIGAFLAATWKFLLAGLAAAAASLKSIFKKKQA